jgi:DNA-binding protein HU-beta
MTKPDLIDNLLTKKLVIRKAEAEKIVESIFTDMLLALTKGEHVAISAFGIFSVSARKARTGRNPQTGEAIKIPAHKVVKFKASSHLKESLGK